MPGCGTGRVFTRSDHLLDLTRLIRRVGRPMTGVDRVEFAYLHHLLQHGPLFGLVRTSLGYVLLDSHGCRAVQDRLNTGDWGPPDAWSRLVRGIPPLRARAEADLRRLSTARCLPQGLARMLRRHLRSDGVYFNTGHSNLTDRVLTAVQAVSGWRIAVMIHDTIPLDYPQFQRPGSVARFAALLGRVETAADVILCNSERTRADVMRHAPSTRATHVALLGVDPPQPGQPPLGAWSGAPFFVCLGTIEPRKNHALLLDIWEQDKPDAHLLICGSRGWENHDVFARLDRGIANVHELPGLPDGAVWGLLAQSKGLLFPSVAEGFGLPPVEAAALGVPVVVSDLPVYREVLGDIPVYAPASNRYLWAQTINRLATTGQTTQAFAPPSWDAHFKSVLTLF